MSADDPLASPLTLPGSIGTLPASDSRPGAYEGEGDLIQRPDPTLPDGEPEEVHPEAVSHLVKVAIVGYTTTRGAAPYGDPEWEVWGMNNLHTLPDVDTSKFTAWFDLHPSDTIKADAQHDAWLRAGADGLPVYVWEPREEWPTSVPFPKREVMDAFGSYFTNSVSWMAAHAIQGIMRAGRPVLDAAGEERLLPPPGATLGIWGVDMAQGTEYAAQRPSCEYFLGVAAGAGIAVSLPDTTDLLSCSGLYGLDDNGALRRKLDARDAELNAQLAQAQEQHRQAEAMIHQLTGAKENNSYVRSVWTQPSISSTSR